MAIIGTKQRMLGILVMLMEQSFRYTKKELEEKYKVDNRTISRDFDELRMAGFMVVKDERHRYALQETKHSQQLKNLLHFSEDDRLFLTKALDESDRHGKRTERIKQKINNIYSYHKLGYANLKKPYLRKLDLLEQAQKEQRNVILKGYRSSNSNAVSDREVEAFHYSPDADIVQAFDLAKNALRHYRISRVERIELTEHLWQHEGKHHIKATDPFHIVSNKQVLVNLRLKVGGYNELIQRFPLCKGFVTEDYEAGFYDFTARVNSQFYGLANFILGNWHTVLDIVEPEELRVHLLKMVKNMEEKLD